MIEEGLPGAGNIILIDNELDAVELEQKIGASFVLEENPQTKQIELYYVGKDFNIKFGGSAQRLPNGNTLIFSHRSGRVFEITSDKKVVWEFQSDHPISCAKKYHYDHCAELQNLSK